MLCRRGRLSLVLRMDEYVIMLMPVYQCRLSLVLRMDEYVVMLMPVYQCIHVAASCVDGIVAGGDQGVWLLFLLRPLVLCGRAPTCLDVLCYCSKCFPCDKLVFLWFVVLL